MVWGLAGLYLRKAEREFDPLARRAAARALEAGRRPRGPELGDAEEVPR
jgi:hypothetical protein